MAVDGRGDDTASQTIHLLEARLRRVEFAIRGDNDVASAPATETSATQRLAALERSLHQLASKSRTVQALLRLHSKHPDLFHPLPSSDIPSSLDTATLLSIVLSSASPYHSTASRLTSILDTPIPPAKLSSQLIELQPRIANAEAMHIAQSKGIAALKARSAALIQGWYEGNVLDVGDQWAEVEGRLGRVEQGVRRTETVRRDGLH